MKLNTSNKLFLGISLLLVPSARCLSQSIPGIESSSILKNITFLASDTLAGRGSGTPGNDKAAQFIASEFQKFHLKPIGTSMRSVSSALPDNSGYFQPFTVPAGLTFGKQNTLSVVSSDGVQHAVQVKATDLSASGKVFGRIIYVGYGIVSELANRDDYKGLDVKNKIVLMTVGPKISDPTQPLANAAKIRAKLITARDKGAKAVLVTGATAEELSELPYNRGGVDVGLPVLTINSPSCVGMLIRAGLTESDVAHVFDGKISARDLGVMATLNTDVVRHTKTTSNIIGLLEGSDPLLKKEVVVIGAHMDHLGMGGEGSLADDKSPQIHHGADDNASGTAGVIALAKYFSHATTRPKRSLLFICFSGEEMGLLGSAHFVKKPIIPLSDTVAMLNMDMIGRMVDSKLIISGTGTSTAWNSMVDDLAKPLGFQIAKNDSGFGASDQQSFYAANVPVLFFFTGLHTDYHKPTDTADKINAKDEARVVSLVGLCADRIANLSVRPDFLKIAAPADSGGARFRVSLGSIPDYAANVEGVMLSGTRAGSPAEKAGLKQGDIIIKFGNRSILNVQDYTVALGEHSPGDKVDVVIKRGTEILTLSVVLAGSKR